ncbi:hypothetical protein SAMN04488543_1306 [Friedmanniella luteola]|uniref:Uncharacterized protein n=1 Tax=Friedmanniella luteola TaxID=546871 RepID=A0A1H1QFC6_9ACTN|nr:hypothetical protein [Friedmanniella luteola]SDS22074.1 hypothetical protein SAMN04488543_1306 [Friedmanniella luteola]
MDETMFRALFELGAKLETRWIDADGAESIARGAGIIRDPHIGSHVRDRSREKYLTGLLFDVAYAVAAKTANPAALEPGDGEADDSPIEEPLRRWARRSARQLEKLLDGFEVPSEPER